MKKRHLYDMCLFTLALCALPKVVWACAVCGVDDSAYITSYLFMTGIPFAVMGVIGGVFFISFRRKKKNSQSV